MMSLRHLGVAVALTVAACSEPPPKPPPPPPPEPAEPEPPPPPKCESIDEACEADADTTLPIPGTDLVFTAPEGWTYAKMDDVSMVQRAADGAFLVLGSYGKEDSPQKQATAREAKAVELAELTELKPPKKLGFGGTPEGSRKVGDLEVKLWQRPKAVGGRDVAHRGDNEGAMLVIAADAGEREVLGVGFAPSDDDDGAAAINAALETIRAEGGDEDDEG